jgi:hypothetical protein
MAMSLYPCRFEFAAGIGFMWTATGMLRMFSPAETGKGGNVKVDEMKARILIIGPIDPESVPGSPCILVEDEGRVIVVSGGSFAEICEGGLNDVNAQAVRQALKVSSLTPIFISSPRTLPDFEFLSDEMNEWTRAWWQEFATVTDFRLREEADLLPVAA